LHGQVHGGIVQGAGQALTECGVHDAVSGQVITGSFMDYAMPRASMVPPFQVALVEDPPRAIRCASRAGGEAGIRPSPAAIMNAVVDALAVYGIVHLDMPANRSGCGRRSGRRGAVESLPGLI
jgi:aerobic carbon-monoxide dehydrogenase large subunit